MAVRALAALGAAPYQAGLIAALHPTEITIARRCVDVPDLLATAAARQADVALVDASLPGLDADVVSRVVDEGVPVVALAEPSAAGAAQRLLAMGASAVVEPAEVERLVAIALGLLASSDRRSAGLPETADAAGESAPADPAVATGSLIAVWGPGGAPGRSTVALNLAAELAARGRETLLVDADVYGGSIAQMLGMLDESSGLLAATRQANAGTLDAEALSGHCREVEPRLRVLTGLPRADRWVEAKSALVRTVLATARRVVATTVVDLGFSLEVDEDVTYDTTAPRRNGATLEVLERADLVVVVGSADPVGLARLIRACVELPDSVAGVAPLVAVNRLRPELGWSRDEIADLLSRAAGLDEAHWLPFDLAACDRALVRGASLRQVAEQSKLSRAFQALAAEVDRSPRPRVTTRTAATVP